MAPPVELRRPRAGALVLGRAVDLSKLVPSGPSVAVGLLLLAAGIAGYVAARETSAFAIRSVEVRGVPPAEAADVRRALRPLVGTSLLSLDPRELDRRIAELATIRGYRHDRAFPHTLVVIARRERPVAVLRRGREAWLVSSRGRVIRSVTRTAHVDLPRVWAPKAVQPSPGATLDDDAGARAARMLALLERVRFPFAVRTVRARPGELTYVLRSGLELQLGSSKDGALKLAIARRIIPKLDAETLYLDLRVPERPVAGGAANAQVEG